ncbi:MAG: hypothetical protein UZ17_ACD001001789 [Acidobacteria bacterium OLB17]|nr:MAG: hypothetical protein UZ17_ACD001001789 [Acidobacteria bacterium OLB17]
MLDAISGLQVKLAGHIRVVLASEDARLRIRSLVIARMDDILGRRVSDVLDAETAERIVEFLTARIRAAIEHPAFEANVSEFVKKKLEDLLNAPTPVGEMFTPEAVDFLKEKAREQVEPAVKQIAEFATTDSTRGQISALVKREVHDYYDNLSFFKKIFVSRDNLLAEVDELVNESFPRRLEEALSDTTFAEDARNFISNGIDSALSRPVKDIVGRIDPDRLDDLKDQITHTVFSLLKSTETIDGVRRFLSETIEKLRPHSVDAILQIVHPEAEERLKAAVADGVVDVLSSERTANLLNEFLSTRIEDLLATPIGRLGDHLASDKVARTSSTLTDTVIEAINAKLPEAIREFDIGGVVREKIRAYPAEKLESLVMSVAKEHLRTIELFGALFGLIIGSSRPFNSISTQSKIAKAHGLPSQFSPNFSPYRFVKTFSHAQQGRISSLGECSYEKDRVPFIPCRSGHRDSVLGSIFVRARPKRRLQFRPI